MSERDLARIRDFIRSELGISLGEEKAALLRARLRDIFAKRGFSSMGEYADWLIDVRERAGLSELADAISTNHTFFYRESEHFEHLENVSLPEWIERQRVKNDFDLRVWCAAASTGEEPYTLGMILEELVGDAVAPWKAGVLGTDVCQDVLERARRGVYAEEAVQKLPQRWVTRFFEKGDPCELVVRPDLRRAMTFRRLNLLRHPFPFRTKFHVVFCRNVMIYFDSDLRHRIADRIYDSMEHGGYLYLGLSETLNRGESRFEFVAPGIFRKPETDSVKGT